MGVDAGFLLIEGGEEMKECDLAATEGGGVIEEDARCAC